MAVDRGASPKLTNPERDGLFTVGVVLSGTKDMRRVVFLPWKQDGSNEAARLGRFAT